MTSLRHSVDEYLAVRRALGAGLASAGRHLHFFVEFAERERVRRVTRNLALRWAMLPPGILPSTRAARLGHVRRFAAWLSAREPRTEVPPAKLLPYRYFRKPPYIYSDDEIDRILKMATRLPSRTGLRALVQTTLFALIASTGLRVSEAIALDDSDVDLEAGILSIRRTKFGKSRFVPVHESARRALVRYVRRRDAVAPRGELTAFFVSDRGRRLSASSAQHNFAKVSQQIGLRHREPGKRHGRGPRLHDLRHRFAAKRMILWYRSGADVEREIPKLATYLGHVHVNESYWYLEAVPELLNLATERLRRARRAK
jgi:integrase